jgi:hypothetical protein
VSGSYRAVCVPGRRSDGVPFCRTHGDYRKTCGFPDGVTGWDLPPAGWRCPYSEERWSIYQEGFQDGLNAKEEQR